MPQSYRRLLQNAHPPMVLLNPSDAMLAVATAGSGKRPTGVPLYVVLSKSVDRQGHIVDLSDPAERDGLLQLLLLAAFAGRIPAKAELPRSASAGHAETLTSRRTA